MPFERNNKLGFVAKDDIPLDKSPLSIKLRIGVRDRLKAIPDWQNKLRECIDKLIEENR